MTGRSTIQMASQTPGLHAKRRQSSLQCHLSRCLHVQRRACQRPPESYFYRLTSPSVCKKTAFSKEKERLRHASWHKGSRNEFISHRHEFYHAPGWVWLVSDPESLLKSPGEFLCVCQGPSLYGSYTLRKKST